ncbi:MAG: hypothetical protein EOP48_31290 [Sphingobacteriales bacterium]|nr:MAG: hypothetical protein EOP48_31290 [Sphingobacteriales bacterium]
MKFRLTLIKALVSCFTLVATSCSVTKMDQQEIYGTFHRVGNSNIRLELTQNGFSYYDPWRNDLALYTCCDTITRGVWVKEGNLLCLSTPQLRPLTLPSFVQEKTSPVKDTLYFFINNPVEDYQKMNGPNFREVSYRIILTDKNGLLLDSWVRTHESNAIRIPISKGAQLEKLKISVMPHKNFGGRELAVKSIETFYEITNPTSNYFEISIPDLTLEYLTYKRLDRDFVRIINSRKLEWDGHFYVRD